MPFSRPISTGTYISSPQNINIRYKFTTEGKSIAVENSVPVGGLGKNQVDGSCLNHTVQSRSTIQARFTVPIRGRIALESPH